mgnify:CR=1 FL=1
MKKKLNKYLSIYLSILFFFAVFFLYQKHNTGNDSTISEWLINYSGGFTKRGIIGQISIFFSNLFLLELRDIIFIFQSLIIAIYFFLLFCFLKNQYLERFFLLSIFTPIFLIYPLAEIEVLARKEVFIFIFFIIYTFIPIHKFKYLRIFKLVLLPLSILVWEPVVFFLPFWIFFDLIIYKLKSFNASFIKEALTYFPSLFIAGYFIFNPMSPDQHAQMALILQNNFNEICYMSCALLKDKSSFYQQFQGNFGKYSFEVFFRYFLIILIGFGPLFILLYYSKLKNNNLLIIKKFTNINLLSIFLILLTPILLLFAIGYDWGRWVNISYIFSFISFVHLYKNNLISINIKKLKNNKINLLNKKYFMIIFIIYCFTWNPKTVITGDVASFPIYRIPYKLVKISLLN